MTISQKIFRKYAVELLEAGDGVKCQIVVEYFRKWDQIRENHENLDPRNRSAIIMVFAYGIASFELLAFKNWQHPKIILRRPLTFVIQNVPVVSVPLLQLGAKRTYEEHPLVMEALSHFDKTEIKFSEICPITCLCWQSLSLLIVRSFQYLPHTAKTTHTCIP